jgi:hypothetical protein
VELQRVIDRRVCFAEQRVVAGAEQLAHLVEEPV